MSSKPRGSYKDQFHHRLYVQLNQGNARTDYRFLNRIQEQMQHEEDEYAHMQHDVADALGMNSH
jgi:hypothetical protein